MSETGFNIMNILEICAEMINNNIFEAKFGIARFFGFLFVFVGCFSDNTFSYQTANQTVLWKNWWNIGNCGKIGEIAKPILCRLLCTVILSWHAPGTRVDVIYSSIVLQFWGHVNKWQPLVQLHSLPVLEKNWLNVSQMSALISRLWVHSHLFLPDNLIVDYWNTVIISW